MARGGARHGKRTRGPHLKRRGRIWYAYLARGDVRTLDTDDEATARERFRAMLSERRPAKSRRDGAAKTLSEIAAAYVEAPHGWTKKGLVSEKHRAVTFAESMKERRVIYPHKITPRVLDEWRTARMKAVSRATVARDEAAAKRTLAWGCKRGMCAINPFDGRSPMREPARPKRRVIHSPSQVASCVAWALDNGLRGWALTCATLEATGFRIDEARRMTEAWITATGVRLEPEGGTADTAWTSKAFKPRMVELSRESIDVVREFLAWRDKGHGRAKRAGVSERWYAKPADAACKALKLPQTLRPHDSRRRWVTELVRAGVPLTSVRELIGHADVQTTEGYVCAYYDDPTTITAATSAAVSAFTREPASVLPMRPLRRRG